MGRRVTPSGLRSVLVSMVGVLLLFSYSTAEESVEIVVKEGDYLIKLAQEYLEDPKQWREVARINRLKNPDLIYPRQVIAVPVRLLRGIPMDAVVSFVHGDVRMLPKDGSDWVPVHAHRRIREGTKILTGSNSAVELVFENGTSCLQRSDSVVGFIRARKKGDWYHQKVYLEKGRVITKILRATGRERRFEIETPSAVCAARGTEFRTCADAEHTTRTEVLEGEASVEALANERIVSAGEGTLVRAGEPPMPPKKLLEPPVIRLERARCYATPFSLPLEPVEGAVAYKVLIAKDREGKACATELVVRPGESVQIPEMGDGVYYLHAVSIDELGLEGLPSEPNEVCIRSGSLPPVVAEPVDGSVYERRSIQSKWSSTDHAIAYEVHIARDREFSEVVDEAAVSERSYRTRELHDGRYYFRIRSIATDGYKSSWSDVITFAVAEHPPPALPEQPPEQPAQKRGFAVFLGIAATMGLIFSLFP